MPRDKRNGKGIYYAYVPESVPPESPPQRALWKHDWCAQETNNPEPQRLVQVAKRMTRYLRGEETIVSDDEVVVAVAQCHFEDDHVTVERMLRITNDLPFDTNLNESVLLASLAQHLHIHAFVPYMTEVTERSDLVTKKETY